MSLTRKHYEQFAHRIAQSRSMAHASELSDDEKRIAISPLYDLALKLCIDFALDNPRFDRQRFLTACGF